MSEGMCGAKCSHAPAPGIQPLPVLQAQEHSSALCTGPSGCRWAPILQAGKQNHESRSCTHLSTHSLRFSLLSRHSHRIRSKNPPSLSFSPLSTHPEPLQVLLFAQQLPSDVTKVGGVSSELAQGARQGSSEGPEIVGEGTCCLCLPTKPWSAPTPPHPREKALWFQPNTVREQVKSACSHH